MNSINIPYRLSMLNSNSEVRDKLTSFLKEQGFSKVALITTKTPSHLITDEIEVALFKQIQKVKTFQVIDASISYINQIPLRDFNVVIGIGGGKVIDVAKYAACINEIPCISIPTTISNDGICSPIAVLKEKQNKFNSLGATMPIALFVPLHLVERSNPEIIVSGIGDLLSNLSAIEDWQLASKDTDELIDDYSVMISKTAALSVFTRIKNYILQRKTKEQFLKDNLREIIESLALSGIAMEIAGTSRPASGAEHLISHAVDELYGGINQHGIQVAFGMYIVTFLRSELGYISKDFLEEIRAVFRFLNLPTTLSHIGLTKEELIEAIIHTPTTRPDRYTILNKINLEKDYISEIIDKLFETKITIKI